jgi:hypothetical protein
VVLCLRSLTTCPNTVSRIDRLIAAKVPPDDTGISLFNKRARCALSKLLRMRHMVSSGVQFYRQTPTYIIENLNAGVLPRQIEVCHHRNPGGLATLAGDGFHKATVLSPVFPSIVKPTVYQPTKGNTYTNPTLGSCLAIASSVLTGSPLKSHTSFLPFSDKRLTTSIASEGITSP